MFVGYRLVCLTVFLAFVTGCGGDPPLFPVTGKVTLGGKPYERLIVYFRPVKGAPTRFNIGVGETDAKGILKLRSSAGMGMQAGEYRVTFSCYVMKGGQALGVDQKSDEVAGGMSATPREIVPAPYTEGGTEESPLIFKIESGKQSDFVFDIPAA